MMEPAPAAVAALPAVAPPNDYRLKVAEQLARRKHRVDGWTPLKVAAFIEHLSNTGSVTEAAAYVRLTTASCYALRNHPDGAAFADAWEAALSSRHEILGDIAMDRVQNGVPRDVWYQGFKVGESRRYSDRLLMFLLQSSDPVRRRSRQVTARVAEAAVLALPGGDAGPVLPDAVRGLIGWADDDGEAIADELAQEAELAAEGAAYVAVIAARDAAARDELDAGIADIDTRTTAMRVKPAKASPA